MRRRILVAIISVTLAALGCAQAPEQAEVGEPAPVRESRARKKPVDPVEKNLLRNAGVGTTVEALANFVLGEEARTKQLVRNLGSEKYRVREAATKELILMGELCLPYVQSARDHSNDPEVVERTKKILREARKSYYPKGQRLTFAAVRVLGASGDEAAVRPLLTLLDHKDYYVSVESAKALHSFRNSRLAQARVEEMRASVEKLKEEGKDWVARSLLQKIWHMTGDETIGKELHKPGREFLTAWPRYRGNLRNTGRSPHVGSQTGALKWKYKTEGPIVRSPAIGADGTVYIPSTDGHLYALTPGGKLKWKFDTVTAGNSSCAISSSPAIGRDGTVYFGMGNRIHAVDTDGALKWKFEAEGEPIRSSPAIDADGCIYFGAGDGCFYALSAGGEVRWKFKAEARIQTSPAVASDGTIYFGSHDYHVYALTPDGKLKWKFRTLSFAWSSPAVGEDGTVYFGSSDGHIYALKPSGDMKWKYKAGDAVGSSPALAEDGTIYAGCYDGHLHAVNPDGTGRWKFQITGDVTSSPVVGKDGTIYIGSGLSPGDMYAISPGGKLKWKVHTGSQVASSVAIGADGTTYFGSEDRYLYAVGDE